MPTSIYYFTGTGNSLHVARTIADQLGNCQIMNIAKQTGNELVEDENDAIGIIFPVYYQNAPRIVREFIQRLQPNPNAYVFCVATCNKDSGNAFHDLDHYLHKRGSRLSAGFTLQMVGNGYVGVNEVTPLEKREQRLLKSEKELKGIMEILAKKENHSQKSAHRFFSNYLFERVAIYYVTSLYRLPRQFNANKKCNVCHACERICPVGNITIQEKKVVWGEKCVHCLACFHWCPQVAIEIGNKSKKIARYHHPSIKLGDVISANEK